VKVVEVNDQYPLSRLVSKLRQRYVPYQDNTYFRNDEFYEIKLEVNQSNWLWFYALPTYVR
jgi:hypothetical protein